MTVQQSEVANAALLWVAAQYERDATFEDDLAEAEEKSAERAAERARIHRDAAEQARKTAAEVRTLAQPPSPTVTPPTASAPSIRPGRTR